MYNDCKLIMIYLIIIISNSQTKLIKMQRSPCLFEAVKCRWFMQCLLTYPFQIPRFMTTGEEMSSVGIIVKFRVLKGVEWELGFACFWTRKMDLGHLDWEFQKQNWEWKRIYTIHIICS